MASHKGWDRSFPVKNVATSGGSFNLGKGTLALIDLEGVPTATGLPVINSLDGLPKDRKLQFRVGKFDIANNRSQSHKDWSTETFMISEILKVDVDAPQEGIITDELIIGYDGLNSETAIVLEQAQNEEISITLCGEVIGALGYHESEVELKLYLETPNTGAFTMQEIVEKAVERFNNMKLMADVPVTNYVEAVVTNSEASALLGTDSAFWTLTIEDEGDSNALGAVQAQYNTFKVTRTYRSGSESTYTIIAAPQETVTAGSFVVGETYEIVTVGTTDFTAIGAASNTVGVQFVATGVGAGTGTANTVVLADYVKSKAQLVKGCDVCAAGYSELEGGFVYTVVAENGDSSLVSSVESNFPNIVAGTTQLLGRANGSATISVVATQKATQAEIDTFASTAGLVSGYVVELIGEVSAVCNPDSTQTFTWVEGESCTATTETYTITIPDDKCGNNKLAEIQEFYESYGLTIAVDAQGGCQTRYTTDVMTNLVCDECDEKFQALITSEPPTDFEGKSWEKEAKVYSDTALMGIKFKAKPIQLLGSEVYRDDIPDFATSARIKVAGGHEVNINESFSAGRTGRFSVTILSVASEPENWGVNLREFEDITKRFQEGVSRHEGNNYGKWILGEETMLDADKPYVDYILTLRLNSYAQGFSGEKNETYQLHFYVEPGKHEEVESLMNTLAGKAGVKPVQAYGNTNP